MKNSSIIAFDIGSSKILGVSTNLNKQGEQFVNAQIVQHSSGFSSGIITNMNSAENSVVNAIYALEKDCHKSIKEIIISLSGAGIKSYYVNQTIKLSNSPISAQDIKKLTNKALQEFKVEGQEIIHYFPIQFLIDKKQPVEDPQGMYAGELSCQLHIIAADELVIKNLIKCFAKCHVEIKEIIVGVYAAGIAVLNEDERKLGTIIIDMGASTTSHAIFLEGKILYVNQVLTGGAQITQDIAKAFSISMREAEKLKLLYGNANPGLLIKDSVIRLESAEKTITGKQLVEVIHPRIMEILGKIKEQYDGLGMEHLLSRQIVITGGGAMLAGVKSLTAEIFQKQVRIAKADAIAGFSDNYNPWACSTILGIIKSKSPIFDNIALKNRQYDGMGWLKKTFLWLKENI